MKDETKCTLACGFKLWEKIYAQFSFIAMGILGTVGIILEDWVWVLPYAVIYWYGIPGIVMRYLICPRCPHLFEYGNCLQLPLVLTRWFVGPQKSHPMSVFEKTLFYLIFILIPVYPIYWLVSSMQLLVPFLFMAAMWYAGQFLYFCRRCRVKECPFNRATAAR